MFESEETPGLPMSDDEFFRGLDDDGPIGFSVREILAVPADVMHEMDGHIELLKKRITDAGIDLMQLQLEVLTVQPTFGSDREFRMRVAAKIIQIMLDLSRGKRESSDEKASGDSKYPGGE